MDPHNDFDKHDRAPLEERLMFALDECGLGRGVMLQHIQRRLRVTTGEAMRLMSLRDACFEAIGALRLLSVAAPYHCPTCGPHVKVDEDECCAACGDDCERTKDAEKPRPVVDLMEALRKALPKEP